VLSLAPLKRLALSARVVTSEPHPEPPSTESLPAWVEEEPTVVAVVEESSAPPLPIPATAVEERQMVAETVAPQLALETPAEVGPGGGDVVVVLDEDSTPPHRQGVATL
jgi:hypothetical protein